MLKYFIKSPLILILFIIKSSTYLPRLNFNLNKDKLLSKLNKSDPPKIDSEPEEDILLCLL